MWPTPIAKSITQMACELLQYLCHKPHKRTQHVRESQRIETEWHHQPLISLCFILNVVFHSLPSLTQTWQCLLLKSRLEKTTRPATSSNMSSIHRGSENDIFIVIQFTTWLSMHMWHSLLFWVQVMPVMAQQLKLGQITHLRSTNSLFTCSCRIDAFVRLNL